MSRVGRTPIPIPSGVEIRITDSAVAVKGPRGELARDFHEDVRFEQEDGIVSVYLKDPENGSKGIYGLSRSLLNNMVVGVSEGFRKTLEIQGAGYRAQEAGGGITLSVGYSHTVDVAAPPGVTLQVEANTRVHVEGIDKQAVGQIAARIRAVRPPGVYTGKGIRYAGEQVRRKAGKGAGRRQ